MKTAGNTGVAQQGFWPILCERVCGLENENETFFVELWHVCYTKSCVKKFCGGKINEIYSGTISCADVNMMPHCLTSENKHAIKLMMQSNDAVNNIQHRQISICSSPISSHLMF